MISTRTWLFKATKIIFVLPFIIGGLNHFVYPEFYLKMMPAYLPWHAVLIAVSGVIEIVLGIALLIPRLEKVASYGIIALLIAVFPANLNMYLHADQWPEISEISLLLRLPGQGLLIAWAYFYASR